MSSTHDDVPGGTPVENPNADVIRGLREAADWLEAHPEVRAGHGFVSMRANDRGDLERLATALGDRAEERAVHGDVEIGCTFGSEGRFDGVRVYGQMPIRKLAGAPVTPEYEPILGEREIGRAHV